MVIRHTLRLLFIVLCVVFFTVFSIANRQLVEISFAPASYSIEIPKFLLSIACFSLGVFTAWVFLFGSIMKARRVFSKEQKRCMALENEIKGIRLEQETPARVALVQKNG